MTKDALKTKTQAYLARRDEVDNSLINVQKRLEEAIRNREEVDAKLQQIRELAGGLGSLPTLGKLREFLASILELVGRD